MMSKIRRFLKIVRKLLIFQIICEELNVWKIISQMPSKMYYGKHFCQRATFRSDDFLHAFARDLQQSKDSKMRSRLAFKNS